MATKRRQQILLGALVLVLAVVLYRALTDTSAVPSTSSNPRGTPSASATAGQDPQAAAGAPDVHLEALEGPRAHPDRPPPPAGPVPRSPTRWASPWD